MTQVYLDGRWVDRDDAKVSAFDAGFQHAVGLFETMLAVRSDFDDSDIEVVDADAHVARLVDSARALGLSDDLRANALADAVRVAAARVMSGDGLERGRVRLTVTGGDLNLLDKSRSVSKDGAHRPTVMVAVTPAAKYPVEMFERGVGVTIADAKANPFDPTQGHKTLNYWMRLRELQLAAGKGAAEALVLQVSNHVAGGCVSNLFAVKDGRLITPIARGEEQDLGGAGALPSPVLPGIVRERVLEWANENGVAVERRMVGIAELLDADEVFLTNSSWGVLPVVRIERETVGTGEVGAVAKGVRGAGGV